LFGWRCFLEPSEGETKCQVLFLDPKGKGFSKSEALRTILKPFSKIPSPGDVKCKLDNHKESKLIASRTLLLGRKDERYLHKKAFSKISSPDDMKCELNNCKESNLIYVKREKSPSETIDHHAGVQTNSLLLGLKDETHLRKEEQYLQHKTNHQILSPFGFLEELFYHDHWRLLVSTIFLNKTSRDRVDSILFSFFSLWPNAHAVANASEVEITPIISSLGLGRKRAFSLVRFSREYLQLLSSKPRRRSIDSSSFNFADEDIKSLYNCGEYATAAYSIFVRGDFVSSKDLALQTFMGYRLELMRGLPCRPD